jgi:hypothetical protein
MQGRLMAVVFEGTEKDRHRSIFRNWPAPGPKELTKARELRLGCIRF